MRAGDLWVTGSRRYKDFEEYLLPRTAFKILQDKDGLDLAVDSDGPAYLCQRSQQLHSEMLTTAGMARAGALQDASIADGVLKVAPLTSQEPDEALLLGRQVYAMLPHIKITDLLVEVDEWTGFTRHFTHLRGGGAAKDRELLLAAILADGINLGIARMAEACPGVSTTSWNSPVTGEMAPLRRLTANGFPRGAAEMSTGSTTPATAVIQVSHSTPISPTSTRLSTPSSSTRRSGTQLMCSTASFTMNPTCG